MNTQIQPEWKRRVRNWAIGIAISFSLLASLLKIIDHFQTH